MPQEKITVTLSARHSEMLKELCAKYFVIPGRTPKGAKPAIEDLIERAYDKYEPREYQTTGFDRQ